MNNEQQKEEIEDYKHWHLDKRVSLSHIGSTLAVLVGLMIWGGTVETRLALGQQERKQQTAILMEIKEEAQETNSKLDEYLEKLYQLANK